MMGTRTFLRDRRTLERLMERYLRRCYVAGSAARVSEFATLLGVNRQHLSATAARLLGISLRAALRRRQMRRAVRLLRETSLAVSQIALCAAFGTERSLYRTFRRVYGRSPTAFRGTRRTLRRRTRR